MIDLWNERVGDELLMLSLNVLAQSTVLRPWRWSLDACSGAVLPFGIALCSPSC